MKTNQRLIVAIDAMSLDDACRLIEPLRQHVDTFKIASTLCTAVGVPRAVAAVKEFGAEVMLDLKLNDIPEQVAGAVKATRVMGGVSLFTVHASAGNDALLAGAEQKGQMKQVGVSILTSLDKREIEDTYSTYYQNLMLALLRKVAKNGCDAVVCSGSDLNMLKQSSWGRNLITIVPGIRPKGSSSDDQKRIMTPKEALQAGADYLVIGRPITADRYPADAAKRILDEMAEAA